MCFTEFLRRENRCVLALEHIESKYFVFIYCSDVNAHDDDDDEA